MNVRVDLYTKAGCHLCEAAAGQIAAARGSRTFELLEHDITLNSDAHHRYAHHIPVVLLNGVEIARYRVRADDLIAAIDALSGH